MAKKPSVISLVLVAVLLSGCGPGKVSGVSSGGISWTVAAQNPILGIHEGTAEVGTLKGGSPTGVTIIVWCAGASGVSSHDSAGSDGAFSEGHFHLPDGPQVEFRCETNDGTTAKVTICGHPYDTTKGSLFLISTQTKETQVKQLNAEVSDFPREAVAIRDFAIGNAEIATFFTDATKDAAVERGE